jgi:hypothetical protein
MTDLKAIKARLDKASPGPWRALAGAKQRAHMAAGYSNGVVPMVLANDEHVLGEVCPWMDDGDRDLIVNARSDIERLYDELRSVRVLLRDIVSGEPGALNDGTAYLNDTEKCT